MNDSDPSKASSELRRRRRIEPVSDVFDPEEIFDPGRAARPLAAFLLWSGPLLAGIGLLAWLRLLIGVPLPVDPQVNWSGLGLDFALLMLFAIPHSLLARGFGRRWLNHPLGPAGERPLYVFITGLSLCALTWLWETSGPVLWNHAGVLKILGYSIQVVGIALAFWAAAVLGGGYLLGLPQIRALRKGTQPASAELVALPPFRWIRHPISLGLLLAMLGMQEATLDRLLMLLIWVPWVLFSAPFEERDAEIAFGEAYEIYKDRTPRWLPLRRWKNS
ncbi:MAG: hypothetical protein DWQ01_02370 [Planctomycetota bacterium]|nr:MAG: hypothetical protein DWQ01_02370 [Planctomycetota bacterium]